MLVAACGPQQTPGAGDSRSGQPEPARARKVLTLAIQSEPTNMGRAFDLAGGGSAGGAANVEHITHNYLVIRTAPDTFEAQLAVEKPSIERGTWQVNPDGSMETTWKLRPNVKWHDGAPFTSADLLFTFSVFKDPDFATRVAQARLMVGATAPDAQTFVVRWSETYVNADQAEGLEPLPRHLLEEAYRTDKDAFAISPYFRTEFVGLGPYRLTNWDQGSAMELARFDDYFLGRPPLDSVIVRFISDPNTMVANILAGTVDAVLPAGVDMDAALEVKRRWAGTGNQVITGLSGRLRHLEVQFRPEYARPVNSLSASVRQGLYHAIDRKALLDLMTDGLGESADSWIAPSDALRPALESSIPQYPYDLARAQQLLAQEGWTRGSDGVLVHPSGERFDIALWARAEQGLDKELNVISDGWKAIGAQPDLHIVPAARANDREYQATRPAFFATANTGTSYYENRLHSNQNASPANRWSGNNRGGHSNPEVDALLDRLAVTIDARERLPLHRDLLRIGMGSVVLMPLYWEVLPVLLLKGVKGQPYVHSRATWRFYEWDKE